MTEREFIAKEWRDERGILHRREVGQELVRCKDCKYLEVHGKTTMYYWCDQWEHYTDEDSFCANSEVRDE